MKHEFRIITLLLSMFILTQLLGLVVIDAYTPKNITIVEDGVQKNISLGEKIPYNLEPPEVEPEVSIASIGLAFIIAILIFVLLTRLRANVLLQIWFTFVVFITMSVALNALLGKFLPEFTFGVDKIALLIAIPLTFYKVFRRNILVHNFTELLVYPGLAAIFVPILRPWSVILLLIVISFYDMWAVWRSKFMVKLAQYQIQNLKIFSGFFVPYLPKKEHEKLQKIKAMKRNGKALKKMGGIKVSLALLGGGDVAFPLIFAGVALRYGAGLIPALFIILGSTLGLLWLFIYSKKGKFYPAMPFITVGALAGWLVSFLF